MISVYCTPKLLPRVCKDVNVNTAQEKTMLKAHRIRYMYAVLKAYFQKLWQSACARAKVYTVITEHA